MNPSMTMDFFSPATPPWRKTYPRDEMSGWLGAQKSDIRGMVNDLREWAWANNGLPANQKDIESIALSRRISLYKLRKNWELVFSFFQKFGERIFFADDEQQRQNYLHMVDKSRESGKLGAKVRREKQGVIPFESQSFPQGYPKRPLPEAEAESEAEPDTIGVPAASAAPPNPPQAAAEAPPPQVWPETQENPDLEQQVSDLSTALSTQPVQPASESEHEQMANRCAELGLHCPDRQTIARIIRRFPQIPIANFPKFPNQSSPGLWLHKTPLDLQLEIARQSRPEPRKPTERERQYQADIEWAREQDRKRKAAGV